MTFKQLRNVIYADLFRYSGKSGWLYFLIQLFWGIGTRYTIWMRISQYLALKGKIAFPFYVISRLFQRHYMFKFGFDIPIAAEIGPGFYIGHFGGITVTPKSIIGKNCNISHGVTIGVSYQNGVPGYPEIGDNVYIGSGAKIFGPIKIGHNVAIGANCVVNKDVPQNSVVVGVPGKVVSLNGSYAYINHTDYHFS